MDFVVNLLLFVFILGLIVLIHELGHLIFAKRAKILCHEFSIGMGPLLYQFKKGETAYSIRAIPLGGFVAMAGEQVEDSLLKGGQSICIELNDAGEISNLILDEKLFNQDVKEIESFDLYDEERKGLFVKFKNDEKVYVVNEKCTYTISKKNKIQITPANRSFESKSLWNRFLTIFAGPFMNFVLAFVIFVVITLIIGKPSNKSIIGSTSNSDLLQGDVITSIDGASITNWNDIAEALLNVNGTQISIVFDRNGVSTTKTIEAEVTLQIIELRVKSDTGGNVVVAGVGSNANKAGLKVEDIIKNIFVEGVSYPITSASDLIAVVRDGNSFNKDSKIKYEFERDGVLEQTEEFETFSKYTLNQLGHADIIAQLGISPKFDFDFWYVISNPFVMIWDNIKDMGTTLGLIFSPKSSIGISDLSGPVGIFNIISSVKNQGFIALMSLVAFLSINIGLINLLPIPALDGGRLLFLGYEAVSRRKINRKVEARINNIAFFLLIGLFIFVLFNDVMRLF